jgi:hypothetical protein
VYISCDTCWACLASVLAYPSAVLAYPISVLAHLIAVLAVYFDFV